MRSIRNHTCRCLGNFWKIIVIECEIEVFDIESYPWNDGQIVCIFVPPQKYENQPYLVSGSVIQGRYMRSGVTIVRRQGDASIPITAEEIHSTLVAGRAFLRGRMGRQ